MSKKDLQNRRDAILDAAVFMAKTEHYQTITRADVAKLANVSEATVLVFYGTMKKLRRDVMRKAVADGIIEIVAQGLANKDHHALKASDAVKVIAQAYAANNH